MTYPEAFPQCSGGSDGANNEDLAAVKRTCRPARVGGGVIKAYAGAASDHGGLAIRIDAEQASIPSLDDRFKGQCATAQNEAILAPCVPVKVNGVKADELRFTVPESLLHPGGLDAVVQFREKRC